MPDEVDEPMTDNGALNAIVVQLAAILEFLMGSYDDVAGSAIFTSVDDVNFMERFADPLVIKTTVSNIGPDAAHVYEEGKIVGIVPAGESLEVPLSGSGHIKVYAAAGDEANVTIASYRNTTP